MKYYVGGRPVRESCNTTSKTRANRLLQTRLQAISIGEQYRPGMEKITVAELAADYLQDYRINERKSLDDAERIWRLHLKPWFGHIRASRVTSELITTYIEYRQKQAENGTINRELSALGRMYSIALQATPPKVNRKPRIKKLPEKNVRTGFITDDPYQLLSERCGQVGGWLEGMLEVGYTFGWRDNEVRKLRVWQVELANYRIVLEVGSTKNGEGRTVKFKSGSRLERLLAECCRGKQADDYVFTRHDGHRIGDFRGVWWKVCCEAGLSFRVCKTCGGKVDEQFCPACGEARTSKQVKPTFPF